MDTAFAQLRGHEGEVSGLALEKFLKQHPSALQEISLQHPDVANNAPFIYIPTYTTKGNKITVNAHFAHAKGYAPTEDHIFKPNNGYKNVQEAVDGGAKILLSLNLDMSYLYLNFSKANDALIQNEDRWKADNRNYYSFSVNAAQDTISAINTLNELGVDLDKDVVALYENAILPYREFYLGKRSADIVKLYNDMEAKESGIVRRHETRNLGFPRLFRFTAAEKTIKQQGVQGIKSAPLKMPSRGIFNHLFSSHEDRTNKKIALQNVWEQACKGFGEIYVLASPMISLGDENKNYLRQLRWVINDPNQQVIPVQNKAMLEFAKNRFFKFSSHG